MLFAAKDKVSCHTKLRKLGLNNIYATVHYITCRTKCKVTECAWGYFQDFKEILVRTWWVLNVEKDVLLILIKYYILRRSQIFVF